MFVLSCPGQLLQQTCQHTAHTVQVKATAGDTHLGGEDFDNRLVNFFTQARPCCSRSRRPLFAPRFCHD